MAPKFLTDHSVEYGAVDDVSPLIRRVTAENPSVFTFHGTGTYVIGRGEVAVIDPGPAIEAHIDALVEGLKGETITHILITHTHSDHSPGAALLKEHTDAPTYAFGPTPVAEGMRPSELDGLFPETEEEKAERKEKTERKEKAKAAGHDHDKESIDTDFVPDVLVPHEGVIAGTGWTVEALHTPGHISNHHCFSLKEEKALFSGDHVMGWSTTVVPPPDGDLTAYLASLELLIPRDEELYYPTHGPAIPEPQEFVKELLAHRHNRSAQILALLEQEPHTIEQMVLSMYAAVNPKLYRPASASVLSHLWQLIDAGRIHVVDDGQPTERMKVPSTARYAVTS